MELRIENNKKLAAQKEGRANASNAEETHAKLKELEELEEKERKAKLMKIQPKHYMIAPDMK